MLVEREEMFFELKFRRGWPLGPLSEKFSIYVA